MSQPEHRSKLKVFSPLQSLMVLSVTIICAVWYWISSDSLHEGKPATVTSVALTGAAISSPFGQGQSDAEVSPPEKIYRQAAAESTWTADSVDHMDGRELLKLLPQLIKDAQGKADLAYALSTRLAWCHPTQAANEDGAIEDDPQSGSFVVNQALERRYKQCAGLGNAQWDQAPAMLHMAARMGWPAARLDIAQASIDTLTLASQTQRDSTGNPESALQIPPANAGHQALVKDIQQLAHGGNTRALTMMAELSLGHSALPSNREDFVTYMLVSQQRPGVPLSFATDALMSDESPENVKRIVDRATKLYQQCCSNSSASQK